MLKYILLLVAFCSLSNTVLQAQTTIWSEDFDPTPSGWNLNAAVGINDPDANFWTISDNEGGVLPPGCGVAANGNNSLHITSTLFSTSGASYNAGGLCSLFGICVQTNTRAESPNISTVGNTNLTLSFDYIEAGDNILDNFYVQYSTNGGTSWNLLIDPIKTPTGICVPQGQWSNFAFALPAACDNIPNLKIGFVWVNNDDGIGTDPSVAINDVKITTPNASLNTKPVAQNDAITIPCNGNTILTPLSNDSDPDPGQSISLFSILPGSYNGTAVISGNTINYTPNTIYNSSTVTITYVITDNGTPSLTDTADITLTLSPCAVVANADNYTVNACGGNTTFNVLTNDIPTTAFITSVNAITTLGSVSISGNSIVYTSPNLANSSSTSFTYTICSSNSVFTNCSTATVTINLTACNAAPNAVADTAIALCSTSIAIPATSNDNDINNGQLISISNVFGVPNGATTSFTNNTITFTPPANTNGIFTFSYVLTDNAIPPLTDTALVTVLVANCNVAPNAGNDNANTTCNTAVSVPVKANDNDINVGQTLTLGQVLSVSGGTAAVVGSNITFTPPANIAGVFTFSYTVCDNGTPALCDTALVTVFVANAGCFVAPIITNDTILSPCGATVSSNIVFNDIINNGQTNLPVNLISTSGIVGVVGANGNSVEYTPLPNSPLVQTLLYQLCDSAYPSLCDTGTIVLIYQKCNVKPVAQNDIAATGCNTDILIPIKNNDFDPDTSGALTVQMVSFPAHGFFDEFSFVYTPDYCYNGTDVFAYAICDGGIPSLCDTAFITVTVAGCVCIPPVSNFTVNDDTICVGDCVTFQDLSINNPTAWHWTFDGSIPLSDVRQNPTVCYYAPGRFQVKLVTYNNFGKSDSLVRINYITVLAHPPLIEYTVTDTIGDVVTLNATQLDVTQWAWTPSTGLSSTKDSVVYLNVKDTISYICNVKTDEGCKQQHLFTVWPINPFDFSNYIWFPNAIVVGSTKNGFFRPQYRSVLDYDLQIYNRFGNRVFTANSPVQEWNGLVNGDEDKVQVFYYFCRVTFRDKSTKLLTGDITVIR
jgi:PKD repeat protein